MNFKFGKFILGIFLVLISLFSYTKYQGLNINDVGLSVLSGIKKIKGDAVDVNEIKTDNTPIINHDVWDQLLQKYVSEEGKVNYKGFVQDSVLLKKYLNDLSTHAPGNNWTENEKLAYWINAYNAFTVELIINHYPIKSIKDISNGIAFVNSPWDIKFFKIGGIDFDLTTIEHEILRKEFNEPRIHFAINCASISCPRLKNKAFVAENINEQLEEVTTSFINNPSKNNITEQRTQLSKIFDWFQSDFNKEGSLIDYIKKYNPLITESNDIEYLDYNWGLNE